MAKKPDDYVPDGYEVIYRRFITRGGKKYFPPKGQKAWRLLVKIRKDKPADQASVAENVSAA